MKNRKKIYIIVFVILFLTVIFIDLVRPIERERGKLTDGYDGVVNAYNTIEKDNEIILTLYSRIPVRTVTDYKFSGEELVNVRYTNYYKSKVEAIFYYFESFLNNKTYDNVKLRGNSISYNILENNKLTTKDEILLYIQKAFGNVQQVK